MIDGQGAQQGLDRGTRWKEKSGQVRYRKNKKKKKVDVHGINFLTLGLAGRSSEIRERQAVDVYFTVFDYLLFGPRAATLFIYV